MRGNPKYLGPLDFFYRPDLSMTYTDYLQQREFHDNYSFQISEQTKELVSSQSTIFDAQVTRLEEAQREAAYEVVSSVEGLQAATIAGFRAVGSVLEWGFQEIVDRLDETNSILTEISETLKAPSTTWAYHQYGRALDRYRRGHYSKALEVLNHAIHGFAGELGEDTDHRFYFLRGKLRLGSFKNNSPEVVDVKLAESDFLSAAEYAVHDHPLEAAKSLLFASRAANLQGNYKDAVDHSIKGLSYRDMAGLHYEAAKAYLNVGQISQARLYLICAIRRDKHLIVRAIADPALKVEKGFVDEVLAEHLAELRAMAIVVSQQTEHETNALAAASFRSEGSGVVYPATGYDSGIIKRVRAYQTTVKRDAKQAGIIEIRGSLEKLGEVEHEFREFDTAYKGLVQSELERESSRRRIDAGSGASDISGWLFGLAVLAGIGVAAATFLQQGAQVKYLLDNPNAGSVGDMLGALFALVVVPVVLGVIVWGAVTLAGGVAKAGAKVSQAGAQDRKARIAEALSQDRAALAGRTLYKPPRDLFSNVPLWAMGRHKQDVPD